MSQIKKFNIEIPQSKLDDLQQRLTLTRWPEKETPDDWTQGIPLSYMKEIHDYWLNDYDWRKHEKEINKFPQFLTTINELDVHFIHFKSPHKNAKPLIITHGWPGSVVEFFKVIERLADPKIDGINAEIAFDVITPSLPGFGFSGKPTKPGFGVEKIVDGASRGLAFQR